MQAQNAPAENNGVVTRLTRGFSNFTSYFKCGYPIEPAQPVTPKYNEFLTVGRHKQIRIIHIPSVKRELTKGKRKRACNTISSTHSDCDELNRPYLFKQPINQPPSDKLVLPLYASSSNYSTKVDYSKSNCCSSSLLRIELFVEQLIVSTINEVFHELISNNRIGGDVYIKKRMINLGFIDDEGVTQNTFRCDSYQNREANKSGRNHTALNASAKIIPYKHLNHLKVKPLIILLHGIGSSADTWWHVINALKSKGYQLIAPDLLGHGYSSAPNYQHAYTFKQLLKHTLCIFDHYINLTECKQSVVVGHSFGCSLASALCRYRSPQIVQLILISGGGPTPLAPFTREGNVCCLNILQTLIKPFLLCGIKRSLFYSLRGKFFEECDTQNALPGHILHYIKKGQNWPEGDASFHRQIVVPTLLIHGLQDKKITLVQECEMERTIPRAVLEVIPNAGHMPMIETPEDVTKLILSFITLWSNR